MFSKFLEDSEMEGDVDTFKTFDSSKVTKVLKVFLSKSQKRVVAKCEQERSESGDGSIPTKQVPIYLLKECRSTVFIDFMKKLIYQAMSPEMKQITYDKLSSKNEWSGDYLTKIKNLEKNCKIIEIKHVFFWF